MARIIEDGGATADILKPFKLVRFKPEGLPDARACVDSAIIINDMKDGVPRGRQATGRAIRSICQRRGT